MSAYDDLLVAPGLRAGMHDELRALEEELAQQRFVGRAANDTVTVTVTGAGTLVDIAITDLALRGSHPENVGPATVTAVHAARTEAARHAHARIQQVLHPTTVSPTPVPVAKRRTRPVVDEDTDLFQGFRSGG